MSGGGTRFAGIATGEICILWHCLQISLDERVCAAGEFFAQGRNTFRYDWPTSVPPFLSNKSEHISDLCIAQRLVPRLHHGGTELCSLYGQWSLQSLQHNHA